MSKHKTCVIVLITGPHDGKNNSRAGLPGSYDENPVGEGSNLLLSGRNVSTPWRLPETINEVEI